MHKRKKERAFVFLRRHKHAAKFMFAIKLSERKEINHANIEYFPCCSSKNRQKQERFANNKY